MSPNQFGHYHKRGIRQKLCLIDGYHRDVCDKLVCDWRLNWMLLGDISETSQSRSIAIVHVVIIIYSPIHKFLYILCVLDSHLQYA